MENADQLETAIFLKPFKGSRASKSIIPVIRRKKNKAASKIQQHLYDTALDQEALGDFEDENRVEAVMGRTQHDLPFRSAAGLKSHSTTIQPFFRSTAVSFLSKPSKKMSRTQPDFNGVTKTSLTGALSRQVIDLRLLGESNPLTIPAKDNRFTTFYKMTATKNKGFVQNEADQVIGKSISTSQLRRAVKKSANIMPTVTKINMGAFEEQPATHQSLLPTPINTQRKALYKHGAVRPAAQGFDRHPQEAPANKYHVLRGARTVSQQAHHSQTQTLGLNSSESRMPRLGRSKGSTGAMGTLVGHRLAFDSRTSQLSTARPHASKGGFTERYATNH